MMTKKDLRAAKNEIEATIETTTSAQKVELLRWLIVIQSVLAGFIAAIVKLIHG